MEGNIEKECSALGGLFQQIITDMKNGTPLWEDLIVKATKLHSALKATIQAIASYLDAFQKIADAATNTRGATKEIGTALTRICLRHKAVEARMKTFTSAIMDCLVVPLQEKLEDWKKTVVTLDKEHAKEFKRARAELKKRSTDTLRLQKKARKGKNGELLRRVESSLQDVSEKKQILEETEKHAVRAALIEERSRYCLLVTFLKPVVDEEVAMLSELSHLQEVVDQVQKHTADPFTLPPASEQVIADLKGSDSSWSFQTPPSSPSSLGSRKSSMCSISSLNSSSSGSTKSHHSPSHHYWHRSLSQQPRHTGGIMRLPSISSQDSGFTSQDALFLRPLSVQSVPQVSNASEHSNNNGGSISNTSGCGSAVILPTTTSTWPNLQETLQFERAATAIMSDRPHTISSAYERGHQRPSLTVYTFQAPATCHSQPASPVSAPSTTVSTNNNDSPPPAIPSPAAHQSLQMTTKSQPIYARPPVPQRCSSLERPFVPSKSPINMRMAVATPLRQVVQAEASKALGATQHSPLSKVMSVTDSFQQPTYVNMHELASMAASKAQEMNFPPPPPELTCGAPPENQEKCEPGERDGSSESSLESSSGYGSQTTIPVDDGTHTEDVSLSVYSLETASKYCTLPRSGDLVPYSGPARRPVSTSGYPTMRNTLLRRGSSVQGQKPPPPVRRTSSISNTARQPSLENLPPPPAFLLENSSAESPVEKRPGLSVADTVRTLTELNHQPASPNSVRRNGSIRSQSADRRASEVSTTPGQGLIAALSAKLAPSLSPRNSRRHSEDLNPATSDRLIRRGVIGPGQGFLHALNSKLALQHQQHQQQQQKAARVRQWIASRTLPDPTMCHESLMDQIKRGTTLRRTGTINDRSAPKIR